MDNNPTQTADGYLRMRCPYCRIDTDVEIVRHSTASPRHIDVTCRCQNCGERWPAAEEINA